MTKAISDLFLSTSRNGFIQHNETIASKALKIVKDKNSAPLIVQIEGSNSGGKTLIVDTFRQIMYGNGGVKTKFNKNNDGDRNFEFYSGLLKDSFTPITFLFSAPNTISTSTYKPLNEHIWRHADKDSRSLADVYMIQNLWKTDIELNIAEKQKELNEQNIDRKLNTIEPDIRIHVTSYGPLSFWLRRMDVELLSERAQQAIPSKPKGCLLRTARQSVLSLAA